MSQILRDTAVLLWDDHPDRLLVLTQLVESCGARAKELNTLPVANSSYAKHQSVALVSLADSPLTSSDGLQVIAQLKQNGFKIICYAPRIFSWPIALRCGALLNGATHLFDSASPTFVEDLRDALTTVLKSELEERREEELIKTQMRRLGIVGVSPKIISVFRWVMRVSALSDFPVLVSGETGTGKELIANALHRLDPKRSSGPFIVANCGAISGGLAESEFFGHRRGAFTGAETERKGLFRSANGGILFLDEIGELTESLQAKLLRVLQEKRVLGVGFDQEVPIDVRVVVATNRNLEEMVAKGDFREDLYHRLNVLSVTVPALRERPEDLRSLVEHFLNKYCSLNRYQTKRVTPDFVEALTRVELPGNARQLENIIRSAILNKTDESPLGLCDLTPSLWRQISDETNLVTRRDPKMRVDHESGPEVQNYFRSILDENSWNLPRSLDFCEKALLQCALQLSRGNQSQAARLMGITPRSVYNKLHKYKLHS